MEDQGKLLALDGTELNKKVFETLFNEINTYEELPKMLELVTHDVVRTEFDRLKEHAIGYHVSGMVDIILGVQKALKHLEEEMKIFDMDIEEVMDDEQYLKYVQIKQFFTNFR
jgi:hypothetical protein